MRHLCRAFPSRRFGLFDFLGSDGDVAGAGNSNGYFIAGNCEYTTLWG
jgi:hypothetical protein